MIKFKGFKNVKNIVSILIPVIIIMAAFIVVEFLYCYNQRVPGSLSAEEAANKAINYINQVALENQTTASLLEVTNENGLYKIRLEIQGEEYESYISKDGKLLFSQGIDVPEDISTVLAKKEFNFPKTSTPKAELFVMSFCPYGNQAEELMMPVVNLLTNKVDLELHYVIYSDYAKNLAAQGYSALATDYCFSDEEKYCSMHGIQELNQNIRELCVQKYQKDKLWNFIEEINYTCTYQDVDSCWENVAKNLGMNVQQIKTCQKSEALDILAQEAELNEKYGIQGSPQLIINKTEYLGSRTSEGYKQAICSAFESQPEECSQVLGSETSGVSGECE